MAAAAATVAAATVRPSVGVLAVLPPIFSPSVYLPTIHSLSPPSSLILHYPPNPILGIRCNHGGGGTNLNAGKRRLLGPPEVIRATKWA